MKAQKCRKSKAIQQLRKKKTQIPITSYFFSGEYTGKISTIFFFVREFFFFIGTKIMVPERGTKMRAYNIAAAGNPIRESGSGSNVVL